MEQPFSLPEAFEPTRIADHILGDGYENTPAPLRAWIKTTLALVQTLWPECPDCSERTALWSERGFGRTVRHSPAPWVLAVLGANFAAAPRLAAALMCARLAGAHNIVAIWSAAAEALPPQLAATLELAGVEHTLALCTEQRLDLANELRHVYGRGRVLLFPGNDSLFSPPQTPPTVPTWRDVSCPALGLTAESLAEAPDLEQVLRWAHPDGIIQSVTLQKSSPNTINHPCPCFDALYTTPASACHSNTTPLQLHAGLEGCWLPADLDPYFFQNVSRALFQTAPRNADFEDIV